MRFFFGPESEAVLFLVLGQEKTHVQLSACTRVCFSKSAESLDSHSVVVFAQLLVWAMTEACKLERGLGSLGEDFMSPFCMF